MAGDLDPRFRPPAEHVPAIMALCECMLPVIREAARAHGYAIGVHGSMQRDLDLIAAPWVADASDADTLARAIRDAIVAAFGEAYWRVSEEPGAHGRVWANIYLAGDTGVRTTAGVFPFIDLSIMPRASAAA